LLAQGATSEARLDTATVQRMVDEVVGPDPANGPPVSRAYEHKSCHAVTTASGDYLVRLECAFRPHDGAYCGRCQKWVGLDEVCWEDTGETSSVYRQRLRQSVGFWRRMYLTVFCNAYQGAINLHLDSRGRPLPSQAE
jgi:hypothetical protein